MELKDRLEILNQEKEKYEHGYSIFNQNNNNQNAKYADKEKLDNLKHIVSKMRNIKTKILFLF